MDWSLWTLALPVVAAAGLSQFRAPALRRWASLAGLAGAPFWFHLAWSSTHAVGWMIACAYLAVWLPGLWACWRAPQRPAVESGLGTIQITPGR